MVAEHLYTTSARLRRPGGEHLLLCRQSLSSLAVDEFDPARGASRVAATACNTSTLASADCEHEPLSGRDFHGRETFYRELGMFDGTLSKTDLLSSEARVR